MVASSGLNLEPMHGTNRYSKPTQTARHTLVGLSSQLHSLSAFLVAVLITRYCRTVVTTPEGTVVRIASIPDKG